MSIVVDLPAPFGPSSATVSPGANRHVDAAHRVDRAARRLVGLLEAEQLDAGRAHALRLLPSASVASSGVSAVAPTTTESTTRLPEKAK